MMNRQTRIATTVVVSATIAAGFAAASGFASREVEPAPSPIAAVPFASHTFTLDNVHTSVVFRIEHAGVSNFYGCFRETSGTFIISDDPATCSFVIEVKTDSVDTRNEKRDKDLKSTAFFNAAEFPTMTFKSTKIEKSGDNLKVTGDFTMHGVTKPITADIKVFPPKDTKMGFRAGFDASCTIKRSDFGMTTYVADGGLGDEVTVRFGGEGTGNKAG